MFQITELPGHPRGVTLDEQHLRGMEVVPPNLLYELTRPTHEDAGAHLLRSHNLPESVQGRELILHHRSSVGHRGLAKSHESPSLAILIRLPGKGLHSVGRTEGM